MNNFKIVSLFLLLASFMGEYPVFGGCISSKPPKDTSQDRHIPSKLSTRSDNYDVDKTASSPRARVGQAFQARKQVKKAPKPAERTVTERERPSAWRAEKKTDAAKKSRKESPETSLVKTPAGAGAQKTTERTIAQTAPFGTSTSNQASKPEPSEVQRARKGKQKKRPGESSRARGAVESAEATFFPGLDTSPFSGAQGRPKSSTAAAGAKRDPSVAQQSASASSPVSASMGKKGGTRPLNLPSAGGMLILLLHAPEEMGEGAIPTILNPKTPPQSRPQSA